MTNSSPSNLKSLNSLQGHVALVTGGTRGIGFAIAQMLLDEGARVAICGTRKASIEQALSHFETADPNKVKGEVADVSDYDQVRGLFEFVDAKFGALDVLVNCAGIGEFSKISAMSAELWSRTLGTNLTGAFYCSREALSRFEQRGRGDIVNISSLAGKNAFAGGAAYNASKAGLNAFGEAMMLDTRYDKVRVSTVMPGSVATGFGKHAGAGENPAPGLDWKIWPEDVAEVVRLIVRMPARTMIGQVEIRPALPKRI